VRPAAGGGGNGGGGGGGGARVGAVAAGEPADLILFPGGFLCVLTQLHTEYPMSLGLRSRV